MRKLLKALALKPDDWRLLLRAWCLLLLADVRLRRHSYRQVQAGLAFRGSPAAPGDVPALVRRVVRFTDLAARHHLRPMSCLRRALAMQRLLAERGVVTQLRIGVRKDGKEFGAHAWLEYAGKPIHDGAAPAGRFAPLAAPGARTRVRPIAPGPAGPGTDMVDKQEKTHGFAGNDPKGT
jgi:hypothetical protein